MFAAIFFGALLLAPPSTAWLSFAWTRPARYATTAAVSLLAAVTAVILLGSVVRDVLPSRPEAALLYVPAVLLIIGTGLAVDRRLARPDSACRTIGWFGDYPTCVIVSPGANPGTVSVLLTTALGGP